MKTWFFLNCLVWTFFFLLRIKNSFMGSFVRELFWIRISEFHRFWRVFKNIYIYCKIFESTGVLFALSLTDRGLVQQNCESNQGQAELSLPAERRECPSWQEQILHAVLFPHIHLSEFFHLTAPPHRRLESLDLLRRTRRKRRKCQWLKLRLFPIDSKQMITIWRIILIKHQLM